MSRCCIILNNMLTILPVMMEASTGNLNPFGLKKSFSFTQERNEVDDVNKASETVCALNSPRFLCRLTAYMDLL